MHKPFTPALLHPEESSGCKNNMSTSASTAQAMALIATHLSPAAHSAFLDLLQVKTFSVFYTEQLYFSVQR